ncbi:DHA2 family efflux MFS transporter permease subunit [Kitasatospora sp. NPDC086801]|uniref:DHA2 family efflux MFS transporter permease subunit n=1 Tax=Kitasatospora sp. NPDC086801 TaxID=3364066 RepID=UPI00381268D6
MTTAVRKPAPASAPAPPSADQDDEISPRTWRLAWVIALGAFTAGLDTSLMNIALDTIQQRFHADLELTQWVASGYLLALAVALPACAWLGRRVGPGRLWLAAVAAFTLASVLCALAPTIEALIALRALQGLAAGVLIPTGQTVLGQAVGPGRLGRVMARLGIAVVLAPALGPTLGGLMLHSLSWHWLFLLNVPLGAAALVLGRRHLPMDRGRASAAAPLDWVGYALIGLALPLLVYGFTSWGRTGSPEPVQVLLPLAVGAAGLAAFVRRSLRREQPLVDMRTFRHRGFAAAGVGLLANGALGFGSALLFPLYFQLLHSDGVVASGLQLLPLGLGTAVTLPFGGRLTDRYGGGPVAVLGAVLGAVATGLFAATAPGLPAVEVLLFVLGMGGGLVSTPLTVAAFGAVGRDRLPDATVQVSIMVRLGGALGAALFSALLSHGLAAGADQAFRTALWWQFATAVAATGGALLLWRHSRHEQRR